MTTDKKRDTKISNVYKKNAVRQLMKYLLAIDPTLTKTDIRRIFNYGYRLLWKNGDEIYEEAGNKTRSAKGQVGLATIRTDKRGSGSNDVRAKKIRRKQLAERKKREG